ncbi:MAG: hypothetical protein DRI01_04275 [Chloroflexi bacterium]|nr:MAG: hypothetical protein DRI01_04275 [Chloroflexota bacterium]
MWKFNGCPRCERDVFVYQTVNGMWHERCFRCGYRAEVGSMVEAEDTLTEDSLGQAEGGVLANE